MTAPVPSASESGRLRWGFFTSPAVKVTLFQASEENSDPTCETARIVSTPTMRHRPADSDLHRMQRAPARVAPEVRAEVGGDRVRVASDEQAEKHQSQQRAVLAKVKTFCTIAPVRTPKMFSTDRKTTTSMAARFCVFRPTSMLPSTIGPKGMGGTFQRCNNPVGRRDGREEDAEKLAERHADGGDGSGLDDEEQRPAVEKSPQRAQRFAQVNVLPAGMRHHGSQFTVGQRAGDGHEAGHQPGADQQRGRVGQARDVGGDDEDAGADHRAHDQRGRAGKAEPFYELAVAGGGDDSLGFGANEPRSC